jgi:endonuclease G
MKLSTLVVALLATTGFAYAADPQAAPKPVAACAAMVPYGAPSSKAGEPVICRPGYILEHNNTAKIPGWVAWTLTPEHVISCLPRADAFAADQSLGPNSAKPTDYAGSGYDQGHLANNADMSYDATVARESFIMSNMSPQLPGVNRGTWKNLESAERAWVYSNKAAYTIIAGNIWSASSKTIGANKVVVPDALYKILVNNATKQSIAFIIPNIAGTDQDFTKYQVTVADVEKASGYVFAVPDAKTAKNKIPAVDLKTIAADKKNQCKA